MKNLWLLLAITTLVSCTQEKKVDYAILSGQIENADNKKITIYSQYNFSDKKEFTLNEDGSFLDTLRMNSDFFTFRLDNSMTEFYAPKGSNLSIKFNAKSKDATLQFTGNEIAINNYIKEKGKIYNSVTKDIEQPFLKNETEFKGLYTEIKKAELELLNNTQNLPKDFINKETKNLNYSYLGSLGNYEAAHRYYAKNKDFKVSEDFLDEKKSLDFNNEDDFLFSVSYRGLVETNLREKAQELVKKDTTLARDISYLKTVASLKSEIIKNKLLYNDAQYGITYTDNLEEFYTLYSNNSTNEANNKKIFADYNKLKSLATGSPSPKFTNYENNAGGTKSLEDLKGKYVYIDVWATWCGPCIGEIPSLKKVEKEFHGKNVQFLSISIDDTKDHEKWKKMIVDKELGGMQLFADNNWDSQFIQDYMIKGIPRFILLDPEGNIVNANAPRPSDKKLVETLNGLNL